MHLNTPSGSDTNRTADGSTWIKQQSGLDTVLQRPQLSMTRVIFLETAGFKSNDILRTRLQEEYQIPPLFWTTLCQRSNGYFGCEDIYDDNHCLLCHNTWFRFQIKQISTIPTVYTWYDFTFFTTWTPTGAHTILCFDVSPVFQSAIHSTLLSEVNKKIFDVYFIHSSLLSLILKLYDESVWALRDHVRDMEKKRMVKPDPETDYPWMHEVARHACHSSETLLVAIETISKMHKQYSSFQEKRSEHSSSVRLEQFLDFQEQMLRGQHTRSVAVEARLKNELNLALNLVAQQESAAIARISQATQLDGEAQRVVAMITLLFLPSTFVSTLFSTTFFAFVPGSEGRSASWAVSEKFWIYWVFSVPLTVIAVGCWYCWQRR